ncbi:MAG: tRNA (N6-threonylcarbamoyladenosine(37)-N6)-methyltransferase TrmO [Deltaproteobacteria bacterium]|nr:tRNA (N6-threonylcarbamoyladenosine(37)-N6)-methyltransferase TrmO [Deltaproteobacteria bacterium]
MTADVTTSLTLVPIGVIHTSMALKFDAPHQPENSRDEVSVVELFPGHNFEQALRDLNGFDRIWLVWWFHRNTTWNPMVLPPRGSSRRRGVFATRSPHRPNPIGLTSVPLIKVEGRKVYVGKNDLLDGTPILDIKPYLVSADAFPDSSTGWLAEVDAQLAEPARFQVVLSALAEQQAAWLKDNWEIDFLTRARELLARDPSPHRTRRIASTAQGNFRMGCGAWRTFFSVEGSLVTIERLAPGYPPRLLMNSEATSVPYREAQLAFNARWPAPQVGHS